MTRRFAVRVPAKVNLHLEILGRRPDGYHELRTLYQSIDLRDRLTVEENPDGGLSLEVEPPGAVTGGDDNLVLRAAVLLARSAGIRDGARFVLTKRIPVEAGLGGGSADAAAALVLLDRLWRCGLDGIEFDRLAKRLGCDVPFFLHGGLCAGLGRGDEITELPDLSRFDVVVAVPEVGVPTAAAFDRWARRLTSYPPEGTVDALAADPRGLCDFREMANGFEETVVDGWPEVGEGLRILRSHDPVHASLSGSGSASFAVFKHRAAARRAAADLPGHWFVHVGSSVPRERARLAVEVLREGGG